MKKIKDFLRQLMLLYKRLLYCIAKIMEKPDEKTVIFEAFQGRYVACNPKALYEEMKNNEKYKDYKLIWSLRNTENRFDRGKYIYCKIRKFSVLSCIGKGEVLDI